MIYEPSPLILNENEPVRCLFSKKIRPEEIQLYDGKTYIFDAVYVNQKNATSLLSPPILNHLKKKPSLSSVDTACLHFLGITTNWKSLSYRERAQSNRKDLVDDPLLIELKRETS